MYPRMNSPGLISCVPQNELTWMQPRKATIHGLLTFCRIRTSALHRYSERHDPWPKAFATITRSVSRRRTSITSAKLPLDNTLTTSKSSAVVLSLTATTSSSWENLLLTGGNTKEALGCSPAALPFVSDSAITGGVKVETLFLVDMALCLPCLWRH